ncbi:MAG: SLBB domain-containing protein [Thermodesulfobacteriota bacterium]
MIKFLRHISAPVLGALLIFFLLAPHCAFSAALSSSDETRYQVYRVSPRNVLVIEVFEAKELGKTVRVSSDGFITLPLLGAVKVIGLTEREVQVRLEELLEEKFLQDPHVSVFVKQGGYFYVLGKVATTGGGRFSYQPGITLQQAIAMAGGFSKQEDADLRNIQITRDVPGKGKHIFTVDHTRITEGNIKDLPIMKDDVIFVNSLGKFFVSGFVRSPMSIDLRQDTTLQQAIASAGGISDIGKSSKVQLTRTNSSGEVEILKFNYRKIKAGKADDIKIYENDIIYVPRSYFLGFVRAFFFSIGFGDRNSVGVNPTTLVTR